MSNFKEYFAIETKLRKQGFHINRHDVIGTVTSGRKHGLTALTPFEYAELIRFLNANFKTDYQPKKVVYDEAENKQRRKIIALLSKIGYVKEGKSDMYRINCWAMSHGHLDEQKLNDYHGADLTRLVYQAECYYKSTIERL
jgi:hypothetical protein